MPNPKIAAVFMTVTMAPAMLMTMSSDRTLRLVAQQSGNGCPEAGVLVVVIARTPFALL